MKPKPLITEFTKLFVVYIITWLLMHSLSIFRGGKDMLDINLHDTSFVITLPSIIPNVFFLLITLIYLMWEGFYHYKRRLQNVVLLAANFLFIIKLYFLAAFISGLPTPPEWTVYPPLSALPQAMPNPDQAFERSIIIVLLVKQITPIAFIIFMLTLVIIAILTGKNWNFNKKVAGG